jgi:Ser/Thr protein kinase RdoA (MazF antagonist)
VLAQYPIRPVSVRLANHAFNTTFAVKAEDGRKFALRLNTNSHRTPGELEAETSWVEALGEAGLRVAQLERTVDNRRVASVHWNDRKLSAVLYSWLPGRVGDDVPSPAVGRALGETARKLHEHARTWRLPEGAELNPIPDVLFGKEWLFDRVGAQVDLAVFEETRERGEAVLATLRKLPPIPIHFDLHLGNVKWHRNKLALFDFDDCILGWPDLDAAVSSFYLRRYPSGAEIEGAYRAALEPPTLTASAFEALVAVRAIFLANELCAMTTANLIEMAPKYAAVTEKRLRRYLATGVFDPSVAAVQ